MPVQIDHIVIAGSDLAALRAQSEARGLPSIEGGVHVGGQTHNALIGFPNGTYLELIAPTPGNTAPDHAWSEFMRTDGVRLEWRTAKLGDAPLGSVLPFLIQDLTPRELRVPTASGIHEKIACVEAVVFGIADENDPIVGMLGSAFNATLINDNGDFRLGDEPIHFDTSSSKHGLSDMRLGSR